LPIQRLGCHKVPRQERLCFGNNNFKENPPCSKTVSWSEHKVLKMHKDFFSHEEAKGTKMHKRFFSPLGHEGTTCTKGFCGCSLFVNLCLFVWCEMVCFFSSLRLVSR